MDPDVLYEAAQNLYGSSSSFSQHRPLLSHSHSINLVASQEAAAGWRRNGRMSSVRRFFCLYCTFDMLFTSLIWLICVMLTGDSIWNMWKTQVLAYTFPTSLIDVVGVAVFRFVILLLAYAAIHLNHWFVVALTTSGTCAFLIAKVFMFDWTKTAQPVFEVFLVLASFSLCWSEAWFLDCKVLPSELQAREIFESVDQPVVSRGRRIGAISDVNSIADYYSPRDSPSGSPIFGRKILNHPLTASVQDEEYRKKAGDCLENVLSLLSSLRWNEYKRGTQSEDVVQTMNSDKYGNLFLLTGYVECPAEFLYEEFTQRIEEVSKWNPTILESKLIQRIDHETDITYQLTAGGGGGAIKPRDFVNLRRNTRIGDRFISCGTSVEYPGYPPTKKYIRGENKISCWAIQPVAPMHTGDRAKCKVQWLMGCDLKGWIPQYVLDVAFSSAMFEFLDTLRVFVGEKHADGTLV
ncbi:steroidogenic acute regulatory protein-like isoform X2 [Arctopsyche grandis]|uniref:steroidogenic acute regulatory protein-like isoform X2 n=1 Tax=Arctopsyche grandis TaxID=121162 RepID=UPI00406DA189